MQYSLIIDVVVAVLLVVTISYAITLNKRLGMLRRDRADLEKLAHTFTASTERANESLGQLQSSAEVLQHQIDTAQALRDDLAFLTERGESAANRLEDTIRASRGQPGGLPGRTDMAGEAAQEQKTVKETSSSLPRSPEQPTDEKPKAVKEYSQSDAERDLLNAIRSAKN